MHERCTICGEPSVTPKAQHSYCKKHLRLHRMRWAARYNGKTVPSLAELEALLGALADMKCPVCFVAMNLCNSDGPLKSRATLQHNEDGTHSIWCLSCNSRYQPKQKPQIEVPDNFKFCRKCQTVRPQSEFWKESRRKDGRCPQCIHCRGPFSAAASLRYYHRNKHKRGR